MSTRLGMDAKLYRNAGSFGSPIWTEVTNVKDLTLNLEKGEADVTTRANGGWRATVGTLKDASIDFIFSSLCLQWVHPLPEALREIRRVLKPGGLTLFSTFGPDTLIELREAYLAIGVQPPLSPFAAIQQIGDALQGNGFSRSVLERDVFTLHYGDVRALMRELQALGATDARSDRPRGLMGKHRWQALNAAYPAIDSGIVSSWEVIGAMAFRPERDPVRFEHGVVAHIDPNQIRRRVR